MDSAAAAAADQASIDANAVAVSGGKKPVWKVPSNGSIEVGHVMGGAVSWPALSDTLKSSSDGCSLVPPATSLSPEPLISSPSVKPTASPSNPSPIPNPMPPTRHKSMGRFSGIANGGVPPQSQPSLFADISRNLPDRHQPFHESFPKGSRGSGGPLPQNHSGSDQHRGYQRGNNSGGPHQNHHHGPRRDQDWNHPRGPHIQQPRGGGGFRSYPRQPPPPPISPPFIGGPPPPLRPFIGNAMGFHDLHSMYYAAPPLPPESFRGVPFVPPPMHHPMFFPVMDPQREQLLAQIDYYFSDRNLCKDTFLRSNMDEHGWVPISLIAGFNRVKQLTQNIQYILHTVQMSTLLEVQGEKIRRRSDWMNWLMPSSNHSSSTSAPLSPPVTEYDAISTRLQNVNLEGLTANNPDQHLEISGNNFRLSKTLAGMGVDSSRG